MTLWRASIPTRPARSSTAAAPAPIRGSEFAAILEGIVPGIQVDTGFPWSMAQGGEIEFDMSKAKRLLDFAPRYALRETIQSIKEWIDAGGLEEDRSESDRAYSSGVRD